MGMARLGRTGAWLVICAAILLARGGGCLRPGIVESRAEGFGRLRHNRDISQDSSADEQATDGAYLQYFVDSGGVLVMNQSRVPEDFDTDLMLTRTVPLYAGSGHWASKAALPLARSDHQAVAVGDLVYIVGGLDASNSAIDDVTIYDTVLDTFSPGPALPTPLHRFGIAFLSADSGTSNGTIYVMGGLESADFDALASDRVHILDLGTMEWSEGPPLAVPRSDLCGYAVNGKVLAAGGYAAEFASTLASVEVLDLSSGEWAAVEDMPTPRGDVKCGVLGDKFVVAGGFLDPLNLFRNTFFRQEVEAYDTVTEKWEQLPDLPVARGDVALVSLPGGRLLSVGGETHGRGTRTEVATHSVYEYTTGHNTWVEKAPIPAARFRMDGAHVNGVVYVFGGHSLCDSDRECVETNDTQAYFDVNHPNYFLLSQSADASPPVFLPQADEDISDDFVEGFVREGGIVLFNMPLQPEKYRLTKGLVQIGPLYAGAGSWTQKAKMPFGRSDHQVAAIGDFIGIFGGVDASNATTDAYTIYDTVLDTYLDGPPLPGPLARFGIALLPGPSGTPDDGKVYIIGGVESIGENSSAIADVRILDLETARWSDGPPLKIPRAGLCAAQVGGKIYAAGGWTRGPGDVMDSVEVLDPEVGEWAAAGAMPAARRDGACGALGGRLVVAGGWGEGGATAEVEAYDTVTQVWDNLADLPQAVSNAALVTLPGEGLLLIGGQTAEQEGSPHVSHGVFHYLEAHDTWVEQAQLPGARLGMDAAAVDGVVYAFGGSDCTEGGVCVTDDCQTLFRIQQPDVFLATGDGNEQTGNSSEVGFLDDFVGSGGVLLLNQTTLPSSLGPIPGVAAARSLFEGTGFWTEKTPMPFSRSDHQVVGVGDLIYIIGGLTSDNNATDDVIIYDTVLDTFSPGPTLPTPLMRFGAAFLAGPGGDPARGQIYVMGGFESSADDAPSTAAVHILDLSTGAWSDGPAMAAPRSDLCGAAVGGKVYAAGGWPDGFGETLATVEVLEAGGVEWGAVEDMPTPRGDVKCGRVGARLVVAGGYYDPSGAFAAESFRTEVQAYDTVTESWTSLAPLPDARGDVALAVLPGDRLLSIGGETHARGARTQVATHTVSEYDASQDVWVPKAPVPAPICSARDGVMMEQWSARRSLQQSSTDPP
ncbi:unnamed protein product [Ostreobium quekettii]|uniref:Uncharacterized protein n=1 Tax=Ostreobium quekettii TaxID=121088 RepID=A0A8S1IVH2_9CHLO|nr:unnamed protein product [Ostreobium quekettii]